MGSCLKRLWTSGTVRNADLIYVLSRGTLVEKGNHASLMEKPGRTQNELNSWHASAVATQDLTIGVWNKT